MNLIVKKENEIIYTNDGHWLHPLFDLMDFLNENKVSSQGVSIEDKLIGRGAAVLIATMNITKCHGRILSKKAIPILKQYKIDFTYDKLVETLQCQTEDALTDLMSLKEAYLNLKNRAGHK